MSVKTVYECDCGRTNCKQQKKDTNHWALFKDEGGTLILKDWDASLADAPGWGHLYGDECISAVVAKWRHEALGRAKKDKEEKRNESESRPANDCSVGDPEPIDRAEALGYTDGHPGGGSDFY
jgi:hypothetical protein